MQTKRDLISTHNERVKLFSGFTNALGLGMVGFAVIRPLTDALSNVSWATFWWAAAGLAFHAVSHYILRSLRKEA